MAQQQRTFDAVTILGVAFAIALMVGGIYLKSKHEADVAKWRLENPEPVPAKTVTGGGNEPGKSAPVNPGPSPSADPKVAAPGETKGAEAPPVAAEVEPADAGDLTVSAESLRLVFSAKGATLSSAFLSKEYVDPMNKKEDGKGLELLTEIERGKRAFGVPVFEIGPPDPERAKDRETFSGIDGSHRSLDNRVWKLVSSTGDFTDNGAWKIVYSTALSQKYTVTKTFTIPKSGNYVLMDLAVDNGSGASSSYSYTLNGPQGVLLDNAKDQPKSPYASIAGELAGRDADEESPEIKPVDPATAAKGVEEKISVSKPDNLWASVRNRFYVAMLVSTQPKQVIRIATVPISYSGTDTTDTRMPEPNLGVIMQRRISDPLDAQNQNHTDRYALYMGPNDEDHLRDAETEIKPAKPVFMADVVHYCDMFGWRWPRVDWVARKMMLLFRGLYWVFGSYGIAVIVMTLCIKVAMHPMQRNMMISMNKMAKLKPELDKITAKYKDQTSMEAKQKMQVEQRDLQMKAGVNPVAGCLPMFITIPIFSALYGIFNHAFEIRGAEFLWIRDLSQEDHLTSLPFYPHVLNVLPLIYMVMTVLQTRLNPQPKSDDPQQEQQRKMMMFMPLMFSFMFSRMPAGLVLYFAANAMFGMAESWYIRKYLIKDDGATGATAPAALSASGAQPKPAR